MVLTAAGIVRYSLKDINKDGPLGLSFVFLHATVVKQQY